MFTSLIKLVNIFLSLASSITQMIHDRDMMEAGEAKSILEGIKNVQNKVAIAKSAAANANKLPVSEDPNNRDNQK
jgi:hypothetical protein